MSMLKLLFPLCLMISASSAAELTRSKRSVGQFGDMIRYATGREALLYNDYGRHCGFVSAPEVEPVDEVDRCCRDHDQCYVAVKDGQCSSSWFGPSWVRYSWDWDASSSSLSCSDAPGSCDRAVCDCDTTAANCFANARYNEANKNANSLDRYGLKKMRFLLKC